MDIYFTNTNIYHRISEPRKGEDMQIYSY